MDTSSTMGESPPALIDIDGVTSIWALAFSANGEYLVSGGSGKVQVWQVKDGKRVATLVGTGTVNCLAVSPDGKWIAGGTAWGELQVWDAKTYEHVFAVKDSEDEINGLDFSPDSTRLVVASDSRTATVWDISAPTCSRLKRVLRLRYDEEVTAAKFSPQGVRIATATQKFVCVHDSNNGRLLLDIQLLVRPSFNTGLLWSSDRLFVVSDGNVKQVEISTGSVVSEWPVHDTTNSSCIALSQYGEFIGYSSKRAVTFWDTSAHTQLALVRHAQEIRSIAFSPGDRLLAIGGEHGKITINNLSCIAGSIPLSRLHLTFQEPEIQIDDAMLHAWMHDRLGSAEALLTTAIRTSHNPIHQLLASRALLRSRLRWWDAAIDDAEESIKLHPTMIGYIAKSIAYVCKGEMDKGCRACDIAFEHFHSKHVTFLLLIKAVILFIAGKYDDAISRLDDLIDSVRFNSVCYVIQAYMYLLLGNSRIKSSDYLGAIQLFRCAKARMRHHRSRPLLVISLISGWKFDNLAITIQQHLCEALYSAGCTKEAGEVILEMTNTSDNEVYASKSVINWVSDFTQRYLATHNDDIASKVAQHDNVPIIHGTLNSMMTTPLLREWAKATLGNCSWKDALVAADKFVIPRFMIYQVICEHLGTVDRITDARECLQQMTNELAVETSMDGEHAKWVLDFKQRCAGKLARFGDEAEDARRHDDAINLYSVALSLQHPVPQEIFMKRTRAYMAKRSWEDALDDTNQVITLGPLSPWGYERVLTEWARVEMKDSSWKNALTTTRGFKAPRFTIYQALCDYLDIVDDVQDATECFHQMESELGQEIQGKGAKWVLDFKSRLCGKLEHFGDTAMNKRQHAEAISHYSAALSLNPTVPQALLVKRSESFAASGLWKDALNDANEAIRLDPSFQLGYERKYTALCSTGRYSDAIDTFQTMLSNMSQPVYSEIHERSRRYIDPTETVATIRAAIENAIRESPLVLINTNSGRLLDKSGQAVAFESQPIFVELISSMATGIDQARIEREVTRYYRYAMFSHKWGENEPSFEKAIHTTIYDLEESPIHDKHRMFCKIVRDSGINWAWSDTCCINKSDHFVLQEALVSMFKWYQGSAMTVVHLCGVRSPSKRGDLVKSLWNTRAWTFQEYHASKVVLFYSEDWALYRSLDIPNHKDSPEIISEMEEATGVSAGALMALRPGLDCIRGKLHLASTRQTTRVEDAAYSLLGIFSISLPVVYGEGDKALGRLLAQLLTSSGDTSILAWTGRSGSFNSCLPASITVFKGQTSHVPPAIEDAQMEKFMAGLRVSSLIFASITRLYDRLNELSVPLFVGQRMKLPSITFKLGPLSAFRCRSGHVFRAQTVALGIVEIRTKEDLSRLDSLYLVNPWIDFLLGRQPVGSVIETIPEDDVDDQSSWTGEVPLPLSSSSITSAVPQTRTARFVSRLGRSFSRRPTMIPSDVSSLQPPSSLSDADKHIQALQVIARLRQPFGALLLTPHTGNVSAYRRVASESVITVQVEEITPVILNKLIDSVRMLDVL